MKLCHKISTQQLAIIYTEYFLTFHLFLFQVRQCLLNGLLLFQTEGKHVIQDDQSQNVYSNIHLLGKVEQANVLHFTKSVNKSFCANSLPFLSFLLISCPLLTRQTFGQLPRWLLNVQQLVIQFRANVWFVTYDSIV